MAGPALSRNVIAIHPSSHPHPCRSSCLPPPPPPPQVKSLFLARHPCEDRELGRAGREDFAALLALWRAFMRGRPKWSRLLASAEACNYDAVQHGLAHALE